MSGDPMDGPLLKVERANYHIRELEAIFRRYIHANAKAMHPKRHADTRKTHVARFGLSLPRHVPAVIGDAVHNLRVSLDHAYWIMVEDNGGKFRRTVSFPFGGDLVSVKASLNGHPADTKPREEVIDLIVNDLQPFPLGRYHLYDLHTLDILDKHKLLIPTKLQIKLTDTKQLRAVAGEVVINMVGGGTGTTLISNIPTGGNGSVFGAPGWDRFEYTGNLQDALSILFGDGPFDTRPVLNTLTTLAHNVASAIQSLAGWHSRN